MNALSDVCVTSEIYHAFLMLFGLQMFIINLDSVSILKVISYLFSFMASDGKMKLKAMLPSDFASEIHSGNLQNLGLIRILDYTCNTIPNQPDK